MNINPWILLAIAIVVEVTGTSCLNISDGFRKPIPTTISLISFVIALYLMSVITRSLPLGIVYAVWSGAGIVLTALVGFFAFGQKPDLAGFLGISLIISGVLVINLFSHTSGH